MGDFTPAAAESGLIVNRRVYQLDSHPGEFPDSGNCVFYPGLSVIRGPLFVYRRGQRDGTGCPGNGQHFYHIFRGPILVFEPADTVPRQSGLDCFQYFPVFRAGDDDAAVRNVRRAGLANNREHCGNDIVYRRGAGILRETAADIPADVREEAETDGDSQEFAEKLVSPNFFLTLYICFDVSLLKQCTFGQDRTKIALESKIEAKGITLKSKSPLIPLSRKGENRIKLATKKISDGLVWPQSEPK